MLSWKNSCHNAGTQCSATQCGASSSGSRSCRKDGGLGVSRGRGGYRFWCNQERARSPPRQHKCHQGHACSTPWRRGLQTHIQSFCNRSSSGTRMRLRRHCKWCDNRRCCLWGRPAVDAACAVAVRGSIHIEHVQIYAWLEGCGERHSYEAACFVAGAFQTGSPAAGYLPTHQNQCSLITSISPLSMNFDAIWRMEYSVR